MATVLILAGLLVLVISGVDVLWTVLAAGSGAGPLTSRLSRLAWRIALSFGRRPDGPRHGPLAVFGVAIVVGMLVSWVAVSYGAWWLISCASEGAVRVAETGEPANFLERGYFVGFNLFTLGTTTLTAGNGFWQLLPVASSANGLVFLTLGISYLVPVASAVAERRQLAQYVTTLGDSPEIILTNAWNGKDFGSLADHLVVLTPMVHLAGERHLTYPALAYFHSAREQASSSISLVMLDDALTLLRHGVAPDARPDRASLETLRRAVAAYLDTLTGSMVSEGTEPLEAPDLDRLQAAGIPTVDRAEFAAAVAADEERRGKLASLLAHDGWTRQAWYQHHS